MAVTLALLVAYAVFAFERSATQVQETRQSAVNEQALDAVAPALADLCASDPTVKARAGVATCDTAAQAAAVPRDGRDGADGTNGINGRGIVGTDINDTGHLVIAYTDGTSRDVGLVVGRDGAAGRGITGSDIVDGRLVLTYTDGQRVDLGQVVGRDGSDGSDGTNGTDGESVKGDPGRGVASVDQLDGRLIVTYTDGTTSDAGPVPVAAPPPPAAELIVNRSDGTTVRCPRTGGPDTAPVYTCQLVEESGGETTSDTTGGE